MKTTKLCLSAMVAIGTMCTSYSGLASDNVRLTLANGIAPTVPTSWMFTDYLAPRLEEYSEGRIDADAQVAGALCSEHTCFEQALLGEIDIGSASGGNIGAFGKTFDILNLPFIFKDTESAERVMNGWLFDELADRAAEEMDIKVLAIVPSLGFRNVQNRLREVRTPADMKGLKIRVTKSDVERLLISGWGGVAIPFDWANLYEGLETGVVDGMYIPDAYVAARSFYEVTPYITKTGGAWNTHVIFMGMSRYESLPDWAKEVVDKAGRELQQDSFAIDREWEEERLKELEGNVEYYSPTDEEMTLWYAGVPPVWKSVSDSFDPELARRVLEDQGMTDLIGGLEEAGVL